MRTQNERKQELAEMEKGDRVTYFTSYGCKDYGIIKTMCEDGEHAFVVYHCGGNWDDYENYTAARTPLDDLKKEWV